METGAVLYLLVGLPGSGKTVRAREIERSERALRITPDEWMIPLFGGGESRAPGRRDVLEGLLIALALRAVRAGCSVVLDFGLWARDERSALAWLAEAVGARAAVVYMEVDHRTQLERVRSRYRAAPEAEYRMSEGELAAWRAIFQVPTEEEVAGTLRARPPAGFADWSAWATARWPSLPPSGAWCIFEVSERGGNSQQGGLVSAVPEEAAMDLAYEMLFTTVYTLVDEWFQREGRRLVRGRPGAKPRFSDSEVLALEVVRELEEQTSERRW